MGGGFTGVPISHLPHFSDPISHLPQFLHLISHLPHFFQPHLPSLKKVIFTPVFTHFREVAATFSRNCRYGRGRAEKSREGWCKKSQKIPKLPKTYLKFTILQKITIFRVKKFQLVSHLPPPTFKTHLPPPTFFWSILPPPTIFGPHIPPPTTCKPPPLKDQMNS